MKHWDVRTHSGRGMESFIVAADTYGEDGSFVSFFVSEGDVGVDRVAMFKTHNVVSVTAYMDVTP